MLTEVKLHNSIVGHRYTLTELHETLKAFEGGNVAISLVNTEDTERYCNEDEDYKIDIGTKEGTGTIWYTLARNGKYYITEVEFS